jgi:excisionase family DNA binding protein
MTEQPPSFRQHYNLPRQEGTNESGSSNSCEGMFHSRASELSVSRQQMTFEPVLDSAEAAALLHIRPKTLQRLARNGEIPGFRIGKLWGFRASVLNRWLERRVAG